MPTTKASGQATPFAALLDEVKDGVQNLKVRETDVATLRSGPAELDRISVFLSDISAGV